MEVELVAVNPMGGPFEGEVVAVLADVSAGILSSTHECASEIDDEDDDCHSVVIDISKLPPGTSQLKLRIMP